MPTTAAGGGIAGVSSTMANACDIVERALARRSRHDAPRQERDAEREQADDQQRMARVPARDQAEHREHRGERAEAGDPQRLDVGHTGNRRLRRR